MHHRYFHKWIYKYNRENNMKSEPLCWCIYYSYVHSYNIHLICLCFLHCQANRLNHYLFNSMKLWHLLLLLPSSSAETHQTNNYSTVFMLVKFFFSQLCETVEASAWISVKLEIIIENGFVWNWSDQSDQRTHQSHQSCPSVEVVLPWWRQCLTSRLLADSSATVGFPPGRASPAKKINLVHVCPLK